MADPGSEAGMPRAGGRLGRPSPWAVPPGARVAREWAVTLILVGLAVFGASRVVARFSDIVVAVLVAMLLTALLHPLVGRVPGRVPRGVASLGVLLGALIVLLGLIALVGQQAFGQFGDLANRAATGLAEVQDWLRTGPLHLSNATLTSYVTKAEQWLSKHNATIASGALGVTSSATHVVEGFFITMFSTFFFLSSGQRIWAWLLRILPRSARQPTDEAGRSGWVTLTHYIRAQFIVAVVDGFAVGLGAVLLGVPLALALGVVVFLGAFVPIVGALATGVLAVLVALVAKGWVTALVILGVVVLVNQLEAHVLQPFLLGRAVEVHPLAVIVSLAGGAALAGIVGALFAVPVAAVANTIITSLASHGRHDPGEQVADEDAPLAPDRPQPTPIGDHDETTAPQRAR